MLLSRWPVRKPDLTTTCSQGAAVSTADGFHGGMSPADDSGELAFVIIKHVGDATASVNRNALPLTFSGQRHQAQQH